MEFAAMREADTKITGIPFYDSKSNISSSSDKHIMII